MTTNIKLNQKEKNFLSKGMKIPKRSLFQGKLYFAEGKIARYDLDFSFGLVTREDLGYKESDLKEFLSGIESLKESEEMAENWLGFFKETMKVKIGCSEIGEFSKKEIGEAIKCMADEDSRFVFNGVCFGKYIEGTDGRRLFRSKTTYSLQKQYIIPCQAVKKITEFDGETVKIEFHDEYFHARGKIKDSEVFVCGKLISGNFPDTEIIIKGRAGKDFQTYSYPEKEMRDFLKLAVKFAEKPSLQVRIQENSIVFSKESNREETLSHSFQIENGFPYRIAFKADYLLDFPCFEFEASSPNEAVFVHGELGLYVIMPMKA